MRQITVLLFSLYIGLPVSAATVHKISKEWKVDANTAFEISAKEQDFIVEVWDKDLVRIEFSLETTSGNIDEEDFKNGLKIKAEKSANKLSVSSNIDMQNSSVWSWIFNDKKCKNNCTLKNTIYLPKNIASASFIMNYCNLKIGEINLPLKITANYGDVAILKNKQKTIVNTAYSDLNLGEISNLKINGSYSDLILNIIDTLNLSASYCDIKLSGCNQLESLSLSYGDINIGKVGFIKISSTYSEIIIGHAFEEVNASLTYSELSINSISKNITGIGINGVYADVSVKINPEIPVYVSVSGVDNSVHLKNTQMTIIKDVEKNNSVDMTLKTKSAISTSPLIKFNGKKSDIIIY